MLVLRTLLNDKSVAHVLIICVNYVLRIFSKLCPGLVYTSLAVALQNAQHSFEGLFGHF